MKIIDISKCNEEVINYINELQNKYAELKKLSNELVESINVTSEENDNLIRENKRLNNIINELEKYLKKVIETSSEQERITCSFVLQYLQELKGSDKE